MQNRREKVDRSTTLLRSPGRAATLAVVVLMFAFAMLGQEPASPVRVSPDAAAQAEAYFEKGAQLFKEQRHREAIALYQKAIPLYRKADKQVSIGLCLFNIGGAFQSLKDHHRSTEAYRQALPLLDQAGYQLIRAKALTMIAENYRSLRDHKRSAEYLEQAVTVYHQRGAVSAEAFSLFEIAQNYLAVGELERSAEYYDRALGLFQQQKDTRNAAAALSNLGLVYASLDRPETASDYLTLALSVISDIDEPALKARTQLILGDAYIKVGRNADALVQYEDAVKNARLMGDKAIQLQAHRGVGASHSELGNYEDALRSHQAAMNLAIELKDATEQSFAAANMGLVYMELGKYALSFENNLRALDLARRLKDKHVERSMLNNIGVAYLRLGSLTKAADHIARSVELSRRLKDRRSIALGVANLGAAYTRLKQFDKAIAFFDEALPLLRELKEYRFIVIANYYYGSLRRERGELDRAIALHSEAINVAREARTPKFEARANVELGIDYLAQNKAPEAANHFRDALVTARLVKAPEEESAALDGLMQSYIKTGQKALAIFYGKQSINLLQAIRGDITKFDKEIQTNYVRDNEQTYRRLADTLVTEGRIPEAQHVLAMLKEEELTGFVRRDAKEIENLSKRSDLRASEKAALERFNLLSSQVTALGVELAKLEDKKRRPAQGETFTEQARLDELSAQVKDANTAFRVFLEKELAAELGSVKKTEIEADRALQGKLRQWGEGVVAISTIVGGDRYRVILTTPNVQIDGKSEIKAEDLNRKVSAFRTALLHPTVDPRPLGKELYDIIVKPIEKDLAAARATTLLWSLDGTLRYIPMSALWDGEQYLVQKYQNVVVTSTTRQSLLTDVSKDWRILGGGVTKASLVTDENTAQKFSFDELTGVTRELAEIVGNDKTPRGPSPWISLLDAAFTENALKQELSGRVNDKRKFNVVHFATHFRLGSDTADSFLLLGNNKALTLAEISDSPEIDLTDVELVTLSACNTGFGGMEGKQSLTENNGKEVDSLAQFIERRGAKAVMATLWAVVDPSTALLMGQFYRLRQEDPDRAKANALRSAQLVLLSGSVKAAPGSKAPGKGSRSDPIALDDPVANMPPFKVDPKKPFAHPHYWAPFVLIGNWR